MSVIKIVLERSHTHLYTYRGLLSCYNDGSEWFPSRLFTIWPVEKLMWDREETEVMETVVRKLPGQSRESEPVPG